MSTRRVKQWGALLSFLALLGCSKTDSAPPALLPLDQVQAVVQQAFATASADVQSSANDYVQLMVKHDFSSALTQLEKLRATTGLTDDQRKTLARATMTTTRELQAASDSGDEQAAQALHTYKINK